MFNMGGGELLLIALVAILVIKPQNLPKAATTAGRWLAQLRTSFEEIKSGIETSLKDEKKPAPLQKEVKKP